MTRDDRPRSPEIARDRPRSPEMAVSAFLRGLAVSQSAVSNSQSFPVTRTRASRPRASSAFSVLSRHRRGRSAFFLGGLEAYQSVFTHNVARHCGGGVDEALRCGERGVSSGSSHLQL